MRLLRHRALLGAAFLNAFAGGARAFKESGKMTGTVRSVSCFLHSGKTGIVAPLPCGGMRGHDHLPAAHRCSTEREQHDHGRSGMMIMLGDTFHNFVDGILIAAAFMAMCNWALLHPCDNRP